MGLPRRFKENRFVTASAREASAGSRDGLAKHRGGRLHVNAVWDASDLVAWPRGSAEHVIELLDIRRTSMPKNVPPAPPIGPMQVGQQAGNISVTIVNYSSFRKVVQSFDMKAQQHIFHDWMQPWAEKSLSLQADPYGDIANRSAQTEEEVAHAQWVESSLLSNGDRVEIR